MRVIFYIIYFIIGEMLALSSVYAFENKNIRFLTMQEGLSDNTINSILKDCDGFMWFATNNGISKYNGRSFESFHLPSSEKQQIKQLSEVDKDYLWVITKDSLYLFNRKKETFTSVIDEQTGKPLFMQHILKGPESLYWGIYKNSVFSFKVDRSRQGEPSIQIQKEIISPLQESTFSSGCFSSDSTQIYLTTTALDLMVLSIPTSSISISKKKMGKHNASTSTMIPDQHTVWLATLGQGVLRFNTHSGVCQQFIFNESKAHSSLSHVSAYGLIKINKNTFFVPTWNGYSLLKIDDKNSSKITSKIYDNNFFQDTPRIETRMISAYYDPQLELLWIGTRGGGVLLLDTQKKVFKQYNQKRHNEIISIQKDADSYIWLATYHEGLMRSTEPFNNIINSSNMTLEFERIPTPVNRNKEIPYCILKDETDHLWFGYSSSLLLHWDKNTKQMQSYDLSSYKASNGKKLAGINCLSVDKEHRLWLGTYQGLFLFNRANGQCREVEIIINGEKEYPIINHISNGKENELWLSSSLGVCRISVQKDLRIKARMGYEKEKNLTTKVGNYILAGDGDEVYVAYSGGFALISQTKDSIIDFYSTKQGLPSNEVNCITKDAEGRIWLGSNSGISRYSRHQRVFYNYYISGSNRSSTLIDNYLFFGNNKSLTYFYPQKLLETPKTNKVQFSSLEINHQRISLNESMNNQTILSKSITYTDTLLLNYTNKDFSLSFSTLAFNDDKQQYAYRLIPYQQQWILSHEGEKAVYTNLSEGNYLFEVKAVYPDDIEGQISYIHIFIQPHWSKSNWFLSLIIFFILSLLLFIGYRIKKKQERIKKEMQLKHELEIVRIEKEKEKQIKEEQKSFFAHATHELRTPLTLILGPLQDVLATHPPKEIKEKSELALKNVQSLFSLTNQLLYVQKIEAGMIKLKLSEVNLRELIYQEYLFFQPLAAQQHKEFKIHTPQTTAILWGDQERITSAIRNLLSNAFKYTSETGVIELSLTDTDGDNNSFFVVTVEDNGRGIPMVLQEQIFDSFITGQNTASFSDKMGLGLRIVKNTMNLHHGRVVLQSSVGTGSRFTLYFPKGKEHYKLDSVEWFTPSTAAEEREQAERHVSSAIEKEPVLKQSLLIIEDNEEIRKYIYSLFHKEYKLWEAANGEEGIQLAKEKLPDLILSDVIMPIKDGFECCREIRSCPETAHIPIILLTAKAEDTDRMHGSLQGADDYMMKPFNPELLKIRIASLIAQRNQLKRIYTKALMLKEHKEKENAEQQDEFIGKVIGIIEANISNPSFTANTIASELNMSQATFYRKLKRQTDISIAEVIRNVRTSKAASLILTQRYSIQEVAEMVGFNDLPTFRKYFVKQFGILPSHYLEQNK